ncbi:lipocalin-like domain-containing protein [Aequorivita viscosa]|uniref:Uncharacterized domain TIGR03067 protein n=1 Tax=Aequorivita viscosa TaxID=797419 RepID=A0A1M6CMM4_9FLAO|nr:lipocalin family protein [Aequorivita viscosa]SDW38760.1 uncharacterized domain TIGR03067 protein [Aequorivita viscosa]SHI62292.1 uncharacterized domain TIGR03067 protein [Aequorivita viscosa]
MKIVKNLSLILLVAVALIGCSKDDNGGDSASLVGTWKLTAATWNGQPDLEECDLKTTVVFTETTMTTTDYYGTDCMSSESFTVDYTRSGNTLKFSILGAEVDSAEITTLTASTLVVTDTDDGDVYVTTFARQ